MATASSSVTHAVTTESIKAIVRYGTGIHALLCRYPPSPCTMYHCAVTVAVSAMSKHTAASSDVFASGMRALAVAARAQVDRGVSGNRSGIDRQTLQTLSKLYAKSGLPPDSQAAVDLQAVKVRTTVGTPPTVCA